MFGLEPLAMGGTLEEAVALTKERLSHTTFDSARGMPLAIDRLRRMLRIMPPGTRLEPVDDASPIVLPQGCSLEQAAIWVDNTLVVADRELWEAMDARNQAALLAHEVVYSLTRGEGHKNSRRARKIVAHVFADLPLVGAREGRPQGARTLCASGGPGLTFSQFWIYPGANGRLVAQIEILNGKWLYSKSTMTFQHIPFDGKDQKYNVSEWGELESMLEGGKSFGMDATGKGADRVLQVYELDEKGESVPAKLSCYDQES